MRTRSLKVMALASFIVFSSAAQAQPNITTKAITETDGAYPGAEAHVAVIVDIPEGWKVNANKPLDKNLIPTVFSIELPEGFTLSSVIYPEPKTHRLAGLDEDMLVYQGQIVIGAAIQIAASAAPGEYPLKGKLRYQSCNDTQCYAPATLDVLFTLRVVPDGAPLARRHEDIFGKFSFSEPSTPKGPATPAAAPDMGPKDAISLDAFQALAGSFTVAGRNSGYISSNIFLDWLERAEQGDQTASELGAFAGKSLWLVALLTLLGGVLLNLTPCVLPLIPINLAIIGAGASAQSRGRGFALGAAYGAGIAIAYGVLGVLAAIAGTAFGALNASPWFNLVIAVLFVLLVLAMFDVFLIDLSRFQSKVAIGPKKGSYVLAFVMGCIAALLAGACVGPVVISVVLFAQNLYAKGSMLGLALPFLLGAGMALPWPFAGAGMALLPKPGMWMERVKWIFGVLILLLALWYGAESYQLFRGADAVDTRGAHVSSSLDEEGWSHSLAEGLERAKQEGKPVFIDFWASWCKNCLTMDKTTFRNAAVKQKLDGYVKIKFQAEDLSASPTKEIMERFGVGGLGLPVYVVARPNEPGI